MTKKQCVFFIDSPELQRCSRPRRRLTRCTWRKKRCFNWFSWFGRNTGSCKKEHLQVRFTAHQTISMTDSMTVGLTCPCDFSTRLLGDDIVAIHTLPLWLWHCSWILFFPGGLGPPANCWISDLTFRLIFRQMQFHSPQLYFANQIQRKWFLHPTAQALFCFAQF